MKENQNIVGKIVIALAIVIAGYMISQAIITAGGDIGSQIASAINIIK